MLAEGGTGTNHAVAMARSKNITGPYENNPKNPILTAREDSSLILQKSGHADIVETQNGEWYMVHLCGRELLNTGRYNLGRETCIQKVRWNEEQWLELAWEGNKPKIQVIAPDLPEYKFEEESSRDDFDGKELSIHFQTLRIPLGEDSLSISERPGFLRLKGRESLSSRFHQSLIARRQQSFTYTATTCVEFEPESFKQMAGLVCLYDHENYYYLRITHDEVLGKSLGIMSCDNNVYDEPLERDICIEGFDKCYLRVMVDYEKIQFYYSKDGEQWNKLGPVLDASKLSDEYCREGWFTGSMVGLCCQDLTGKQKAADFDFFEYVEG
jgi:xylan 1,4-beta-xylosidase